MIKKIVLIGAGNVATHLGSALCGAGCDVVQVYSRTKESAMELADKLSAEYTVSVDGIRCDADMYIVALKDSALQELLPMLVKGREQCGKEGYLYPPLLLPSYGRTPRDKLSW